MNISKPESQSWMPRLAGTFAGADRRLPARRRPQTRPPEASPASTSDFAPPKRLRNRTISPTTAPSSPPRDWVRSRACPKSAIGASQKSTRQPACPIEQAVEAEDHRTIEDLADVVGVVENSVRRRASDVTFVREHAKRRYVKCHENSARPGGSGSDNANEKAKEKPEAGRRIDVRQQKQVKDAGSSQTRWRNQTRSRTARAPGSRPATTSRIPIPKTSTGRSRSPAMVN